MDAGSMVIEGSSMMSMFDHSRTIRGHSRPCVAVWLCPTAVTGGWLLTTEAVVTPLL